MKATLLIPAGGRQPPFQIRLKIDPHAGSYGMGRLVDKSGTTLDGSTFRRLRESVGASLETDDPDAVRAALGVPPTEPLAPPEVPAESIAARLRELIGPDRGAALQLAGRLGIDSDTLYRYRDGKVVPGAAALLRICRGLGVSLAAFDGCEV
jgi:transcriptional regulator with XRE-family HTH domain